MRFLAVFVFLSAFFGLDSFRAQAEFITVAEATASNTESGSALNTVNGSGFTLDTVDPETGSHVANIGTHWLGGPVINPINGFPVATSFITHELYYKFDSVRVLENILFWNYNDTSSSGSGRGVRNMQIFTSTDEAAYNDENHADWSAAPLIDLTDIPQGPGGTNVYGENFDVADTDALVVQFRTGRTWGNSFNIGFAETRFVTTTAAVPEPSSLLMVGLASFATISIRKRRRN